MVWDEWVVPTAAHQRLGAPTRSLLACGRERRFALSQQGIRGLALSCLTAGSIRAVVTTDIHIVEKPKERYLIF